MSVRTPPAAGPPRRVHPPAFVRHRLNNGLTVVAIPKRNLPVVDVQLVVPAGAVRNRRDTAGLASMTAEMLDEGSRVRSALELSEAVDLLGADLDIRVTWDAMIAGMHVLSGRFVEAMRLLAETVLTPAFPSEELERKREERLNALRQDRDEPRAVAVRALAHAIFGEHPYGVPINGLDEPVARFQREDIEQDYLASFSPERAFLVAAGDIDPDAFVQLADALFGSWSNGAPPGGPPPAVVAQPARIVLIDRPGAPQSEVRFGHPGLARNTPSYFPLVVANTVLGGSFKSRLNMRLREDRGYTYGASSAFAFRRDGGAFTGGTAVFTDVTEETVRIIVDEVRQMNERGATPDEVDRARQYLAYGFARNLEMTSDLVAAVTDVLLYDLPDDYLDRYSGNLLSVTVEDVRTAAGFGFDPKHLAIAIVGDRSRIEGSLQKLEMPLEVWEAE